jgi:hypothetical protein
LQKTQRWATRQFGEEAFDPNDEVAGKDAAIKSAAQSAAYTAAVAYAVARGLSVPMRSGIVRGILKVGEVAALGLNDIEEGKAFYNEMADYGHGNCH